MTASRRIRHYAVTLGQVAWNLATRHCFSLVSAAILTGLAFIVLTSDSFESRNPGQPNQAGVRQLDPSRFADKETVRRPSVLFYVVNDVAQRDELAAAVHADRFAFDAGVQPTDYVVYLIAGTKQEEERTIARLNFEGNAAIQAGVDMRVIDVRGRFD